MSAVQTKVWKITRLTCAVISCLIAAGPIFGFAALKPVLIGEGVYSSDCTRKEIEQGVLLCSRQDENLNFMFTVAATAGTASTLLVSTLLDTLGPRACGFVGSAVLAAGSWMLSRAHSFAMLDGYSLGYGLLGLAGPFIFLSTFQLSNMFPVHAGLILAMLTGATDASSGVFLFYKAQYFKGNGVPLSEFFQWYLAVPVFILLTELIIMPHSRDYKSMGAIARSAEQPEQSGQVNEQTALLATEVDNNGDLIRPDRSDTLNDVFKDPTEASGVWGALHHLSATRQLKSPWFILIVLFASIQMLVINYSIESLFTHYNYLLGSEVDAEDLNTLFDVALPVGGIVAIPFIGVVLDRMSTLATFTIITVMSVGVEMLALLPYNWAATVRIVMLVLYRPYYFTAISDYSVKVFGFDTFGFTYGLILTIAGFANFFMIYFNAWTNRAFHHNPVPVHILLAGLSAMIGVTFVTFVGTQSKHIRRKQLEDEARHAPVSPLPGEDDDIDANSDCRHGSCNDCVCEV